MVEKLRKRIVFCPDKKCEVKVEYSISDNSLSPDYDITACSEFHDGRINCEKICLAMIEFAGAIRSGTDHNTK